MTPDELSTPYTVTEYSLRYSDGRTESLGANFPFWKYTRDLVAAWWRRQRVNGATRQVTGRDPLIDGIPLRLKTGVPQHIDEATAWMPIEGSDLPTRP